MLLALGIILPFSTAHGLGIPGTVLLPMHIPVLLIGLFCGPVYGAACGILIPVLSSILTNMPSFFPMLPIMSGELFTYGLISGLLYTKTPLKKMKLGIYPALIAAMICGRIVYGLIFWILTAAFSEIKALSVWAAITTGLPGIIIQLILIPSLVIAVQQSYKSRRSDALQSAINLIHEGTAACVIIKDNRIIKTGYSRGINQILTFYDENILKNTFVVDKIIGKAAAMVIVSGGALACYGGTMSKDAAEYLKKHHIDFSHGNLVEKIINRTGDGICPMEESVMEIENAEDGIKAIRKKIELLKAANGKKS